jgi:SAM-dependent methyltransferase
MHQNAPNTAEEQRMQDTTETGTKHRPVVSKCPSCTDGKLSFLRQVKNQTIHVCASCGMQIQSPQPSDQRLTEIYSSDYFISDPSDPGFASAVERLKRGTARLQLNDVEAYLKQRGRALKNLHLLEIGPGHGYFLKEAREAGAKIHGLEYSQDAAAKSNAYLQEKAVTVGSADLEALAPNSIDVIVMCDVIEHVRNPATVLAACQKALRKDGIIFVATVDTHSVSARLMGAHWMEYKEEHLFYFNPDNLGRSLKAAGFSDIKSSRGTKMLSASYITGHFVKFPIPVISPVVITARKVLPKGLTARPFPIVASGFNMVATKA